jgi:transcription-repair coupling factor (superfamily II helicase)
MPTIQTTTVKNWKKTVSAYIFASPSGDFRRGNFDPTAAALPVLREFFREEKLPLLVVTPELSAAESLNDELAMLRKELGLKLVIRLLPETMRGKFIVAGNENARARELLAALKEPTDILIGSAHALTAAAPPPEVLGAAEFTLRSGDRIAMSALLEKLVKLDYDDELEVSDGGEFARRGGIVDVFSPAHDQPCRIEFFGDEIESLRLFAPETQRSTGRIDAYRIIAPHPSAQSGSEAGAAACDFFDYWRSRDYRLLALEPELCGERLEKYSGKAYRQRLDDTVAEKTAAGRAVLFLDAAETAKYTGVGVIECYPPLAHLAGPDAAELGYGAIELLREALAAQLRQWLDSGFEVVLLAERTESAAHLDEWRKLHHFEHPKLKIEVARLGSGVLLPGEKLVLLTERELFTVNSFGRAPVGGGAETAGAPSSEPDTAAMIGDLDEGDYAVHLDHGIGIFRGFAESAIRGIRREVMQLEYRNGTIIHVPLNQAGLVSRYIGAAGKVKLHEPGSSRWSRDKAAAGRSVNAYASDMLRLQAMREASPGIAFPADNLEHRLFESSFPFEDTPDQRRSTVEIRADMERSRPMDRLLCGDVGYGKTELAMRAAFKAVAAGFQVAVLAPTTVLVQQHFYSFRERFAEYPFVIEGLSRFRSAAEQTDIMKKLASGGIDIVIGTHKLCNREVRFKNLGLLVIDEEQRFGVKSKEILRQLRADVDVLTMSATPIPRTLYLAMAGARDLSTLQTAPSERLPVRTVIGPEDDSLIAGVIRSEMARGGQIYFLHNRVNSIERRRDQLAAMLPGVRFGVAHGRLDEEELSAVMTGFLERKIDCLICSTIIESGLDIPNANTIVIERADRFGLAELYQLRGRVGRRNHQGYAYLLLPPKDIITSDARKRLAAIRRCSQLGAGFQLALRDLEIRGAGNILGAEQSGHLNSIGFELYCRLLKNEVSRLKGGRPEFLPEAEVSIDFLQYGHEMPPGVLPAAFPPDYIEGVRLRLAAYRRLSAIYDDGQLADFRKELVDRYGKLPEAAENLLALAGIRVAVMRAGYDSLIVADGKVMLQKQRQLYRHRGAVPAIDYKNPPELRLAILRDILRRAAAKESSF